MPLTPLHIAAGWLVFVVRPRRWSFAGLTAGSMIPDLEVPILYITGWERQTGHGFMHSILGVFTIDTFLAVLAVYALYPTLAAIWEGRFGNRWIHFGGVDVGEIGTPARIAMGAFVGAIMHIGVDYLTHSSMPYLWPFAEPVFTFSFAKEALWMLFVNIALLCILTAIILKHLGKMEDMSKSD